MKQNRIIGLILVAVFFSLIFSWYFFDLSRFLSFEYLKQNSDALLQLVEKNYFISVLLYVAIFVSVIAFSLPATGPLTLMGGFLFGIIGGTILSVLSATIGASIAFLLISRQLTDSLRRRYGKQLETFQQKTKKYGVIYILLMNFSMMVPYLIINILAALSGIKLRTVVWTSAIGFIPLALIYTFAGSKLTTITSMNDIFSTNMIIVFVLFVFMFFLPVIVRRLKGGPLI